MRTIGRPLYKTIGRVIGKGAHIGSKLSYTYYVDAVDGLDTNDGLTPQTAFKSISKVNSLTLEPGQSVGFKRGQTFAGALIVPSSGLENNPITFSSYGSGNYPIISQAATSSTLSLSSKSYINIKYLTIKESSEVNTRRAIYASGTCSNINISHCTVETLGYGILVPATITGINISNVNITAGMQAVYVYGANSSNVSVTSCAANKFFDFRDIQNIICNYNSCAGIMIQRASGNLNIDHNYITDSTVAGGSVYVVNSPFTSGTCFGNIIKNGAYSGCNFDNCSGIKVKDTVVYNCSNGFWVKGNSYNIEFENCFALSNALDGFNTYNAHDITFLRCKSKLNGNKSTTTDGDGFTAHLDDYNINLLYCISEQNTSAGYALVGNSVGVMYGCVANKNAGDWSTEGGVNQTRSGLYIPTGLNPVTSNYYKIRNCISVDNYTCELIRGSNLNSDYNVFFAKDSDIFAKIGGAEAISWTAYSSNEANSVYQDPQLTDNVPSTKFEIGENLGEGYDEGLDISTNWGDGTTVPVIVTKKQPAVGAWQVGAYIK